MKVAILSANLGSFDKVVKPVDQTLPDNIEQIDYHCFTDSDFPPITGLTPRFQYRIPKFWGWQMHGGFDYYIWLDGSMSFTKEDSVKWFMEQLGDADFAVFKHPWRGSIKEEADHLTSHLTQQKPYISSRYLNGLHKEQLEKIRFEDYNDDHLYASTAFIYKDSEQVRDALKEIWLWQSRYWTCDQLAFTYGLRNLAVNVINENVFKGSHITHVSKHS